MIAAILRRRLFVAAAGALLVLAAAVGLVLKQQSPPPPRAAGERPELLLLTSLPIIFPEEFTLDSRPSPALDALRSRFQIIPIGTTDARSLGRHRLLLIAQPNAQPAEMLVELDRWVRGGGRALLLADPSLDRPSKLPLGDLSRPPLAFPDTGLLDHWGLRLYAPGETGPESLSIDGDEIRTVSPGRLAATGPACAVESNGVIARCTLGHGVATIIADADFLDATNVEGANEAANLDLLLRELAKLEK